MDDRHAYFPGAVTTLALAAVGALIVDVVNRHRRVLPSRVCDRGPASIDGRDEPSLLSRYFGLRTLSTLYGLNWTAFGLAGVAGPVLMGRVFDATGSYGPALTGFAVATFAVATLMLTLPRYESLPTPSVAVQ